MSAPTEKWELSPGVPPGHDAISIVRELLKLFVIISCIAFATVTLIKHGNPLGFAALLPWALRSGVASRHPRIRREVSHPRRTQNGHAGGTTRDHG